MPLPSEKGKVEYIFYLGQLLVPLLLIVDILVGWHFERRGLGRPLTDKIVLTVCGVWLAGAAGAFFISADRSRFLKSMQKPLLSFYTILFALLLFEIGLRTGVLPAPASSVALWEPGLRREWRPAEDGIPVTGTVAFTVNEIGLRGPAPPQAGNTYKIVAVGGSTTECMALDDTKAWPHLVMDELNRRQNKVKVWVNNAGVSGHTTVHHLEVMRTLPIFKEVNAVTLLIGHNDMSTTLFFEGRATQEQLEKDAALLRRSMLAGAKLIFDHPYYKRLRLYEVSKKGTVALLRKLGKTSTGEPQATLQGWRKRRAQSPIHPLPDLRIGFQEYRERVSRLAQQCDALRLRCLFLTAPTMWRDDLTSEEERLLWGGHLGRWTENKGYVSAGDLRRAVDAYNQVLLDVCAEDRLECLDLAAQIPKNTTVFYDDSHYHNEGARLVADLLVEYLLSQPPFAGPAASSAQRKP